MPRRGYVQTESHKIKISKAMKRAHKNDPLLVNKTKHCGKSNGRYIDGRSSKIHYCECGRVKDRRAKVCKRCDKHASMKNKHHTKKTKKLIGLKSKQKFTPEYTQKNYVDRCQGNKKIMNGYVLIKDYKHPNRNSHNYVSEHVTVMVNYLKHPLNKGEVIHHINFIRDDNRIENLYLYKNIGEHGKCTKSLFKLVRYLLDNKIILFKNGIYSIGKYSG